MDAQKQVISVQNNSTKYTSNYPNQLSRSQVFSYHKTNQQLLQSLCDDDDIMNIEKQINSIWKQIVKDKHEGKVNGVINMQGQQIERFQYGDVDGIRFEDQGNRLLINILDFDTNKQLRQTIMTLKKDKQKIEKMYEQNEQKHNKQMSLIEGQLIQKQNVWKQKQRGYEQNDRQYERKECVYKKQIQKYRQENQYLKQVNIQKLNENQKLKNKVQQLNQRFVQLSNSNRQSDLAMQEYSILQVELQQANHYLKQLKSQNRDLEIKVRVLEDEISGIKDKQVIAQQSQTDCHSLSVAEQFCFQIYPSSVFPYDFPIDVPITMPVTSGSNSIALKISEYPQDLTLTGNKIRSYWNSNGNMFQSSRSQQFSNDRVADLQRQQRQVFQKRRICEVQSVLSIVSQDHENQQENQQSTQQLPPNYTRKLFIKPAISMEQADSYQNSPRPLDQPSTPFSPQVTRTRQFSLDPSTQTNVWCSSIMQFGGNEGNGAKRENNKQVMFQNEGDKKQVNEYASKPFSHGFRMIQSEIFSSVNPTIQQQKSIQQDNDKNDSNGKSLGYVNQSQHGSFVCKGMGRVVDSDNEIHKQQRQDISQRDLRKMLQNYEWKQKYGNISKSQYVRNSNENIGLMEFLQLYKKSIHKIQALEILMEDNKMKQIQMFQRFEQRQQRIKQVQIDNATMQQQNRQLFIHAKCLETQLRVKIDNQVKLDKEILQLRKINEACFKQMENLVVSSNEIGGRMVNWVQSQNQVKKLEQQVHLPKLATDVKQFQERITIQVPLIVYVEVPYAVGVEVVNERIIEVIKQVPIETIKQVKIEVPIQIIKEIIKQKEVLKQVPVEIVKQIIKQVPVEIIKQIIKQIPYEVTKQVIVQRIKEVIKQVPVQIIKYIQSPVLVEVIVEVIKQVPIEVVREVIVEIVKQIEVPVERVVEVVKYKQVPVDRIIEVIKEIEVPIEIIKEIEVPVQIVKEIEVEKEVIKYIEILKEIQVPVQIIKEIPVEVIKEVEVPIYITKEIEVPIQIVREVEVPVEIVVQKQIYVPIEIIKEIEVVRQVPIQVIKQIEVIKQVIKQVVVVKQVVKQVPFEIVREVQLIKQIQKPVYIQKIKEVQVIKYVEIVKQKILYVPIAYQKYIQMPQLVIVEVFIEIEKPVQIVKQVVKQIEIVREVQVLKYVEMNEKLGNNEQIPIMQQKNESVQLPELQKQENKSMDVDIPKLITSKIVKMNSYTGQLSDRSESQSIHYDHHYVTSPRLKIKENMGQSQVAIVDFEQHIDSFYGEENKGLKLKIEEIEEKLRIVCLQKDVVMKQIEKIGIENRRLEQQLKIKREQQCMKQERDNEHNKRLVQLESSQKKHYEKAQSLQQQRKGMLTNIDQKQKVIANLITCLNDKQVEINELMEDSLLLKQSYSRLESNNKSLQEQIERQREDKGHIISLMQSQKTEMELKSGILEQKIEELERDKANLQESNKEMKEFKQKSEQKVNMKKIQIQRLTQQLNQLNVNDNYEEELAKRDRIIEQLGIDNVRLKIRLDNDGDELLYKLLVEVDSIKKQNEQLKAQIYFLKIQSQQKHHFDNSTIRFYSQDDPHGLFQNQILANQSAGSQRYEKLGNIHRELLQRQVEKGRIQNCQDSKSMISEIPYEDRNQMSNILSDSILGNHQDQQSNNMRGLHLSEEMNIQDLIGQRIREDILAKKHEYNNDISQVSIVTEVTMTTHVSEGNDSQLLQNVLQNKKSSMGKRLQDNKKCANILKNENEGLGESQKGERLMQGECDIGLEYLSPNKVKQ